MDMTLPEALKKWVATHPDKRVWTYLDDHGQETSDRVTYRQLDDLTRVLSDNLLRGAKGRSALSKGDRVLLVYPPSLHFSIAFVACLRAGLVAVPVYPPDPRKLKKDIHAFSRTTASCGASVALTCSSYDYAKKASALKAKFTSDDTRWPDTLQWVVTDRPLATAAAAPGPPPSSSPSTSAVVADEETALTEAAAAAAAGGEKSVGSGQAEEASGADDRRSSLAFLQYTSGSTGDPKGVKISHGNLAHNLGAIITELKAGPDTIVVSWLPQYHDMGLIGSLLGTLYCGGTGYYLSPLDFVRSPPTWITAVDRFRATHLQAPNFAFALTARKWGALKTKPAVDLSSVVHLINAAEPIDADSLDSFEATFRPLGLSEGVIKPTYGLAEHTVFVCSGGEQRVTVDRRALEVDKQVKLAPATPESEPSASSLSPTASPPEWCKLVGCGYPARVKGLDVLVVGPGSGSALPEDRVGEVWLRSPSKAHGYWGLPERSRDAFCAMPSSCPTSSSSPVPAEGVPHADGVQHSMGDVDPQAEGAATTVTATVTATAAATSAAAGMATTTATATATATVPVGADREGTSESGDGVPVGGGVVGGEGGPAAAAAGAGVDDAAPSRAGDQSAAAADEAVAGDDAASVAGGEYRPVSALELHTEAETRGEGTPGAIDWSTGYLRTGDEGFMHGGELFICGRIKDLVIVGGRNHYPQDLERTAESDRNDAVRPGCSAAFSVPGEGGGELLVLTAELREAQVKVSKEKRQQLGEEIRSSVVSEHGIDVHHLLLLAPRANVKTTSGKIARQWCRRAFLDGKMKPLLHLKSDSRGVAGEDGGGGGEGASEGGGTVGVGTTGDVPAAAEVASGMAVGGGGDNAGVAPQTQPPTVDPSTLSDEQLLGRLKDALSGMGGGASPNPDVPFYTLGLSSMTAAQFSGCLEQEYGAHVPLSVLDADDTTLRSLIPLVKAGSGAEGGTPARGGPQRQGAAGSAGGAAVVAGVGSSQAMIRESPGKCEDMITNSCPCFLCLLSCPCCR